MRIATKPATTSNVEELLDLERECFAAEAYTERQIVDLLNSPNVVALLSRVDTEIAGFVIGLVEDYGRVKFGHIVTVDVCVKHRRKGIGMVLLKEAERVFSQRDIQVIYLEVRADNKPALQLYRKQGYVEGEVLEDYYSVGSHGLRLMKRLKPQSSDSS